MTPTIDRAADPSRLGRRNVVAGIAGIGLAGVGMSRAFAQDSTPTAQETPAVGSSGDATTTTSGDTRYETFTSYLADQLGSDAATVDTAIRDSLKQMVDDALAAGDISADQATARKARIDESTSPIRLGGGPGGMMGGNRGGKPGGMGGDHANPDDPEDSGDDDSSESDDDATPTI
jgi:hypothetical protein